MKITKIEKSEFPTKCDIGYCNHTATRNFYVAPLIQFGLCNSCFSLSKKTIESEE